MHFRGVVKSDGYLRFLWRSQLREPLAWIVGAIASAIFIMLIGENKSTQLAIAAAVIGIPMFFIGIVMLFARRSKLHDLTSKLGAEVRFEWDNPSFPKDVIPVYGTVCVGLASIRLIESKWRQGRHKIYLPHEEGVYRLSSTANIKDGKLCRTTG
jgi:hypothetical protein